jgi:hypothetical protein
MSGNGNPPVQLSQKPEGGIGGCLVNLDGVNLVEDLAMMVLKRRSNPNRRPLETRDEKNDHKKHPPLRVTDISPLSVVVHQLQVENQNDGIERSPKKDSRGQGRGHSRGTLHWIHWWQDEL